MARSEDEPLLDFLADMRRLRRECPWKREQTHRSLARYLQEEAAETLEAIETGDEEHLREELGDLLLQVYFHAVIAEESGVFTLDDVARGISDKMHRRNPHVFGSDTPTRLTANEVDAQWQVIKAAEKPRSSPYDGIADGLPALLLATKIIERRPGAAAGLRSGLAGDPGDAAGVPDAAADAAAADSAVVPAAADGAGDSAVPPAAADGAGGAAAADGAGGAAAADGAGGVDAATDLGDRLLALVAEAVADGVDPEQALRDAVRRAVARDSSA